MNESLYHAVGGISRSGHRMLPDRKLQQVNPTYPAGIQDSAERGLGRLGNRRLNDLAECAHVNVGGSRTRRLAASW